MDETAIEPAGFKTEAVAGSGIPRNEMRSLDDLPTIPGADEKDPAALAEHLGIALEELPEYLMTAKERLEEYSRDVQRFSQQFAMKTPLTRRQRRAQKFGHHRLHG